MSFSPVAKNILWLSNIEGLSRKTIKILIENFDMSNILETFEYRKSEIVKLIGDSQYCKINNSRDVLWINRLERECLNKGVDVMTCLDEDYPTLLSQISDSPVMLYLKGDRSILKKICVAVVGSRNMTRYGQCVTEKLVSDMVVHDVAIVSGMARGIDTVAHRAALGGGGSTIAVLGSGIDVVYPPENYSLYEEIASRGLIISEYPLGTKPNNFQFPERNRIIAGISKGTLVTEAGKKSGSLITVDLALEAGRDVFAVPSNINSKYGEGCNELIKNAAGACTTCAEDVLSVLGVERDRVKDEPSIQLNFEQERILSRLRQGETHIEELIELSELPITDIMTLLTEMELFGLIKKLPNNMYGV